MEALKGIARRATQTVRDNLTAQQMTDEDKLLIDTTSKVHQFERVGLSMNEKMGRMSRLYGELGQLMKSIAEDFGTVPDRCAETESMCSGLVQAGDQLIAKGAEFQITLREHSQNPISMFLKELPKLKDVEEDRAKKKLEYEFFRSKVMELRKDPPKDTSRIPRNEQILENWRVELWKATETNKAAVSALYSQGMQVIDRSVLVLIQTTGNFVHTSASCLRQHLFNAKLPVYSPTPLLTPSPLPPNPLPTFQHTSVAAAASANNPQWQTPGGWAGPSVSSQAAPQVQTPPPNGLPQSIPQISPHPPGV